MHVVGIQTAYGVVFEYRMYAVHHDSSGYVLTC
jgi:hypothetical protein